MEPDIAVIGAGPCGLFSALTAAKLGAKVVVFEEHPVVGVPTHCAGHISLSGLESLGLKLPSNVIENMFKGANFFSPSGKQFSICFSQPVTCAVNRKLFDQHLASLAANNDVRCFFRTKVDALILQKNIVESIVLYEQNRTERIISKMVIDAEGISSLILKNAGLKVANRNMLVKAVSAEIDNLNNVENDCVEVYFGSEFANGFYAWIIPRRDGTAKIGLGVKHGNPKQCLDYFLHKHKVVRSRLRKSKIKRVSYHAIPLGGPIKKTYTNGFLVVGDSASQVKPTTGGGVITGLTCAKIAGEVAAQAVKEGAFSENFLKQYEVNWRRKIGFDMKIMLFTRNLFNCLSDHEIDKLFRTAIKLRLNETLIQAKNIDFQGRELMRLAKSPSLLATLAYFFFSAFK